VVEEPGRRQILPVHGQRQRPLPQVLYYLTRDCFLGNGRDFIC
jgi:hypothetical protein